MNVLALDTCSVACSVALQTGGTVSERYELDRTGHTRLLLMMVDELLSAAGLEPRDLDLVACTRGPGAFTGVRIGIAAAQGIALAVGIPVAPVSSLLTLAQSVAEEEGHCGIAVAMDARMGEIYWGTARKAGKGIVPQGTERVCPPSAVDPLPSGLWIGVGDGWQIYADRLAAAVGQELQVREDQLYPRARHVLPLATLAHARGLCVGAAQAQPVYLRNKVAQQPGTPPPRS